MAEPIRVLCVFQCLGRGGAESMCMELYRHIDRTKVQFDFVKHTEDKLDFEDEIPSLGGRIFVSPPYRLYNHFSYCRWWKKFLSEHTEYKIIHGHYFTASPAFLGVAKKLGRIAVAHSHCTKGPFRFKPKYIAQNIFLKSLERNSDYRLACSKAAGEWLFPKKGFTVLSNAIEPDKFSFSEDDRLSCRREFGIPEDSLTVGTIGRITFQKNPDGIIDIFKSVLEKEPNARFLWVGDGGMREQVERRVADEGLSDSVILAGVRSDVPRMLCGMDVFILPSKYEGMPVCAVEAQAAGLPCFCSDVITREAAVSELCEFLPLGEPALWAEKITSSPRTRKNVKDQIIAAGYDINSTAKWLTDFYFECLESAGRKE